MALPRKEDGTIDEQKVDALLQGFLDMLDVMNRQIVAMGTIVIAMKTDGPKTFQLPEPPEHLRPKQ